MGFKMKSILIIGLFLLVIGIGIYSDLEMNKTLEDN